VPQPAELLGLEHPLLDAYAQAWNEIVAEQEALAADPLRLARRTRLREMQRRITKILADLDERTLEWTTNTLPQSYAAGAVLGAQQAGGEFIWSQIHQEAVQNLVDRTYVDLLRSTKLTARTTKALVRTVVRDQALQKMIQGRTAVDAGRRVTRILEKQGIHSVVYKDGSKHGLREYGQMTIRTVSATAYNEGTLNAAHSLGVTHWECFDGPDCGWTSHGEGEMANGKIVTRDEALAYPISHPNCRRSFGARPDLDTPEKARAAQGGQVTVGQNDAVRASDAAREARLARRTGSRPARGAAARRAARTERLAGRSSGRV
jgi:hypothetical protein